MSVLRLDDQAKQSRGKVSGRGYIGGSCKTYALRDGHTSAKGGIEIETSWKQTWRPAELVGYEIELCLGHRGFALRQRRLMRWKPLPS